MNTQSNQVEDDFLQTENCVTLDSCIEKNHHMSKILSGMFTLYPVSLTIRAGRVLLGPYCPRLADPSKALTSLSFVMLLAAAETNWGQQT